ncbi:hypothetical protein [Altererythrobacter aquiaggeris]|uniref:hypothetical protein n=1 Tax=Aestuarierythrobacter aquiaggeris TaxID=1898396 RepID=UPI00301A1FF7
MSVKAPESFDKDSVLLRLHDQLDEIRMELSSSEIADSFRPSVDRVDVEHKIFELIATGLITGVGRLPTRYRISRAGIAWVDKNYEIAETLDHSSGLTRRSYTALGHEMNGFETQIDWTKWSAIAATLAIPTMKYSGG